MTLKLDIETSTILDLIKANARLFCGTKATYDIVTTHPSYSVESRGPYNDDEARAMLVAYDGGKGMILKTAVVQGSGAIQPDVGDAIMALHEKLMGDIERYADQLKEGYQFENGISKRA